MKNQSIILSICLGLLFFIMTSQPVFAGVNVFPDFPAPPGNTNITICNNQLPYHWNGITCLTAGTYTAILTAANGSDSTVILHLSVINVGTSITNAIVCDNQLPYRWNGNNYSGSGTYSVTLTSSSGCDSVPILSLTVNHVVTSTTVKNICSNQLPYSWNGNSYHNAGTYNITLASAAGCDSIASLQLIVRTVSASITNKSICSNQLPYHWNGNTYTAAGVYLVTLTGSNGCDSVATLNLSTNAVSNSVTTITICNSQLPYVWNGQSFSTAGNHPVILTGTSGCDSIATLALIVKPILQSNSNITICNGQLPFSWNGNTYSTAGDYQVTLTGSGGCDSIATLHLIAVPILTSIIPVTVCNTELPYIWNGNSYSTAGSYTASFVNSAGCDSVAKLVLTIETLQLLNGDVLICENQLPYHWNGYTFPAAGTYPINPPIFMDACHAISTFTVALNVVGSYTPVSICNTQLPYIWNGNSYTTSGLYTVTITTGTGCDSLAALALTVSQASLNTTSATICSDQLPYSWNGHYYTNGGTYTLAFTGSGGCDSVETLHLTVNPVKSGTTNTIICNSQLPYVWNGHTYTGSGIYTVTLNTVDGCDSVTTLNLGVQPFLTSTTDVSVCNNQLPYIWNGNTYNSAGIYTATFTSSGGCDSIATLNLTVNDLMTGDTTIKICNTQLPYIWNGNTYSSSGDYTEMLLSTGGCDSAATLHLNVQDIIPTNISVVVCNNQLPYSWNGNSYPLAGVYPVTLTSSSGCDSIVILNLQVTDILTSTTNVTVCIAQLPYNWNGNSYSAPGTYSVTTTSPGGCDSVPILSLTVVPYFTSNTNVSVCANQLPYIWNSNSYSAAGIYNATLNSSSSGCDSIATLNLLVKPVLASNNTVTICSNQLPYNWNGNNYTSAGQYNATLTGSNGCDSIATVNLVVNPVTGSNTVISVCNSQLPYNWNGNNYNTAGNYPVTLISSTGCDSVANLALQVKQVTYSNTPASTCSNQLPYNWNGQQFTSSGIYNVMLTNAAGCDSVATLHLTVNIISSSITNAHTCSNQLPYSWNGQSYSTGGLHNVTLVSSSGCDSIATLNLVINLVKTSNTNEITCANQLPYSWNGQSYTTAGNYTAILISSAGCDSLANLHLVVNPIPVSLTTTSTCSSQLPYNWNGQSYTTAGIHTVILQSAAGCDSVANLSLTVYQTPSLPSVVSPVKYCQYDSTSALVAATTNPFNHLLWYNTNSGGTGSSTIPVPFSSSAGTTNFYVSQSSAHCESPRALIPVIINPKPILGPDKELKICFGATANLSALYSTVGNTVDWTYNGSVINNPAAVSVPGIYQLIELTNAGCADTAKVNMIMEPPVIADAGNDDNAEYNQPYQLNGSGGGEYQWSPANLLNNPFIANPLATITSNTSFILMVKDEIGCMAFDTVTLRVLNGPTFYVPTAFTPNGDGVNDIFRPTAVGIQSLVFFRVFNRYGELVYETSELGKGWDGTYKGIQQNTGNFVWSLKGTDRKGDVKILKGNVVLIR